MPRLRGIQPTGDRPVDDNLTRLNDRLEDLEDGVLVTARLVTVQLATGVNRVRHGLGKARGRVTVKLSAAVDLFDQDTSEAGSWVVNASGPATATFLFF